MSSLVNLLSAYVGANPPSWDAFGTVPGVTWRDNEAVPNPDAKPENAYSRSGKLLLAGFGETDLPNGKTGPDADYVRGNEGESGVTLNGNADQVTSIAVMKFYPDTDYRKVLDAQFGPGGKTRLIATRCRLAEGTTANEQNLARNEFFEITLPGGGVLFAEGTIDEEGGKYTPGSTTYFFYRSVPTDRIQSMQCENV